MGFLIDTIPKINTHTADLDAHTKNMLEVLATGEHIVPIPGIGRATQTLAADRLYASILIVARDITVDRIAIEVTVGGAGGTKARLGIYSVGDNLAPGALVDDSGEVAVDSTGVKAITIDQALTKGIYYTALVTDGTPTIRRATPYWSPMGFAGTNFDIILLGNYRSFTYAALPDPFGIPTTESWMPLVLLRVKTLD